MSDNGPQFTAQEFEACMLANGIKHSRTAPYHPATNGEAERFVQTFKRSLRAGKEDDGSLNQKLSQFLLAYRSTPHATTGVLPAELFFKHKIRTRLDRIRPSVREYVHKKQAEQTECHGGSSQPRSFSVGQTVLVRNLRDGPRWLVGVVVQKLGPVSYEVDVNGQVWRRHTDQLLAYKGSSRPEIQREPSSSDISVWPALPGVATSAASEPAPHPNITPPATTPSTGSSDGRIGSP